MSATLIVTATPAPHRQAELQRYIAKVYSLFEAAGGTLVRRGQVTESLHGEFASAFMLMDFPTAEAIRGVFASNAYETLLPIRATAFSAINIAIVETT